MGTEGSALEIEHDELVATLLKDVGSVLYEIYTVYFPHEVRAVAGSKGGMPEDKVQRENEVRLFQFFKDYEICPNLLNKGMVF